MKILMSCINAKQEKMVDMSGDGKLTRIYLAKLTPAKTHPQLFFGTFEIQSLKPIELELGDEYEVFIPTSGIKLIH